MVIVSILIVSYIILGDAMTGFDPYESIGFHCSLTLKAMTGELEKRLHKIGISPAQHIAVGTLECLRSHAPDGTGGLSVYLTLSPSSN